MPITTMADLAQAAYKRVPIGRIIRKYGPKPPGYPGTVVPGNLPGEWWILGKGARVQLVPIEPTAPPPPVTVPTEAPITITTPTTVTAPPRVPPTIIPPTPPPPITPPPPTPPIVSPPTPIYPAMVPVAPPTVITAPAAAPAAPTKVEIKEEKTKIPWWLIPVAAGAYILTQS